MQCVDLGGRRIIKKRGGGVVWSSGFFQAEDGIRDVERSRGLGDVYKRQVRENLIKFSQLCGFSLGQEDLLVLSLIHI